MHSGEGESLTLVCRVYSNPAARVSSNTNTTTSTTSNMSVLPQVLWYKETMKLIEGERLHTEQIGDTYKLTINKMRLQDYGDYYCKASNPLDKGESRAVVVTGAPARPVLAGDSRSSEMYSYVLAWAVQSSYNILQHEIIYWPASRQTQVTAHIVWLSSPLYSLQVDSLQTWLNPPSEAHTRRVPGLMVSESAERNKYNMMGLQNNTVYHVTVRSQNKFGWSPYSSIFTFQTLDKLKLSLTLQEKPGLVLDTQGSLYGFSRTNFWLRTVIVVEF